MRWYIQSKRGVELSGKLERIQNLLTGFREEILPPYEELPWNVRVILSFVHEHLFESGLNASTVRRACKLGNNSVSSRFHWIVGLGLKEYIEACRLKAAQHLLYEADLEVYLIALSVGCDHQETVFRAFLRQTGCKPSEWRLKARKARAEVSTMEAAVELGGINAKKKR